MTGQELSLDSPVFPLCGCDASLPFLEESSAEVSRSADKLLPGEGFLDQIKAVEDNHWGPANINGENVPVLLGELLEGVGQVPHLKKYQNQFPDLTELSRWLYLQVRQRTGKGKARRAGGEV